MKIKGLPRSGEPTKILCATRFFLWERRTSLGEVRLFHSSVSIALRVIL